jgi:translation initiation factor 2D
VLTGIDVAGTHDALVVKLLTARGVPKAYIDVDTSKSKK